MASPSAPETRLRRIIDSTILRDNSPETSAACLDLLHKICSNIVKNPGQDKFKKVKSQRQAFKPIANCKGGLDVLVEAGFAKKVIEFEEHWVYIGKDVQPGEMPPPLPKLSDPDQLSVGNLHLFSSNAQAPTHPLLLAIWLIEQYQMRAQVRVQDKEYRKFVEQNAGKMQIEKVLRDIEIDRQERKERDERLRLNRKLASETSFDPAIEDQMDIPKDDVEI